MSSSPRIHELSPRTFVDTSSSSSVHESTSLLDVDVDWTARLETVHE